MYASVAKGKRNVRNIFEGGKQASRQHHLVNKVPFKSGEIMMFVCLQNDAKHCCDPTMCNFTPCGGL